MFLNNFKKYNYYVTVNVILKKHLNQLFLAQKTKTNCVVKSSCYPSSPPMHKRLRHGGTFVRYLSMQALTAKSDEVVANQTINHLEPDDVDTDALKHCLYNDSDEIILRMNQCKSPKELLNIMENFKIKLLAKHHVQAILLLWNFHRQNSNIDQDSSVHRIQELSLEILENHLEAINPNELSCSYLYLRKMGVPNTHPTIQKILVQALKNIEASSKLISLPALSRLVVGINTGRDFCTPLVCQNFIPHILKHIDQLQTEEEARLLSICLFHLHQLIDIETLNDFKAQIQLLIDKGIINKNTVKPALKVLSCLNFHTWSHQNLELIRNLLYAIEESIDNLDEYELKSLCRIFQYHQEPSRIGKKLQTAIESLESNLTPDTLACIVFFAGPHKREPLIKVFKKMLFSQEAWATDNASSFFFLILRSLKISDVKMCDTYWKGVINEIENDNDDALLKFLRHTNRYMNFNNNLGGTYRYLPFERALSDKAMHAIENDISGRIPSKFCKLAAFVIAYGHTPQCNKKLPNIIISKIIKFSEQLSLADCFAISRGMQIAQELRFRQYTPHLLNMQLATIDNILTTCAERHLRNEDKLAAIDLNAIVRTLANRKSLKNTVVFQDALNRYKMLSPKDMSSRVIRDMAYNFMSSNFIVPECLEVMFEYIKINYEHVMGETVEKVLTCAYNLGYIPKADDVLHYAAETVVRDFNHMSGLSILQASLALCFYKAIPEKLINEIFCVKFIQRIEDEIQLCYSKATYPERVLNQVMQLNRTVCLDFPEANVPWFQQNYVEAQLSKKPVMSNQFSENVKNMLTSLLKESTFFRCNHTTPYGYQIDFVIHFDRNKKPIAAPVETTMLDRITKVAILLLKLDSFCANDITQLRGSESLKMKHLEMMGYKVIHINEHDWNSKYLNAPGAKANYLKCLLQITN